MSSAQEMVKLSSKLAEKIRDGQGAINADETIEFKSVLLSMGIANPVTRQTSGNETKYHQQLAKQLCEFLYPIVKVCVVICSVDYWYERLDTIGSSHH